MCFFFFLRIGLVRCTRAHVCVCVCACFIHTYVERLFRGSLMVALLFVIVLFFVLVIHRLTFIFFLFLQFLLQFFPFSDLYL